MPNFVVEYELPYTHRVQVGVEAESPKDAEQKAEKAFADGSLWDNTAEMPLLFDDYEEPNDSGALVFKTVAQVGDWPVPDASVIHIQQANMAMLACRYLVEAIDAIKASGKPMDWRKAHGAALDALGLL